MTIMIQPENGSPAVSLSNVFNLMDTHGKLMGAIHVIVPISTPGEDGNENITIEQRTSLFFSKGFQYEASGFCLGSDTLDDEAKQIGLYAFQTVLSMIPGLAEDLQHCDLTKYGTSADLVLDKGLRSNVYYAFGIPEEKQMPVLINTSGFVAWRECVDLLTEDNQTIKTLEFLRD